VGALKDRAVVKKSTFGASEMHIPSPGQVGNGAFDRGSESPGRDPNDSPAQRPKSISIELQKTDKEGRYLLTADDSELREILRRGMKRQSQGANARRRSKFSDLIFTRQLTAFDRQNPISASSPFHGFYTLFWLGTALLLLRVGANNWRTYGSVFGRNEIMTMMFHRDVAVLGLTDGVMCASTLFCLILQKAITKGYLSWNKQGWIIQNVSINHKLS
jgi:sterol O-acyltransferase